MGPGECAVETGGVVPVGVVAPLVDLDLVNCECMEYGLYGGVMVNCWLILV